MNEKKKNETAPYFKCDYCSEEFTLESFRIAVYLYGVVFLVGEEHGYVGIVCPNCINTVLKRMELPDFNCIRAQLGDEIYFASYPQGASLFGNTLAVLNKLNLQEVREATYVYHSRLCYSTFALNSRGATKTGNLNPYNKVPVSGIPDNSAIIPVYHRLVDGDVSHMTQHELTSLVQSEAKEQEGPFLSAYLAQTSNRDTSLSIFGYNEAYIEQLLEIENKTKQKVFPRYVCTSKNRELCERFVPLGNFPSILELFSLYPIPEREAVFRCVNLLKSFEPCDLVALSFFYRQNEDYVWKFLMNVNHPFKGKGVPPSANDIELTDKTLNKLYQEIMETSRILKFLWSNSFKSHVHKAVDEMYFEFVAEYYKVASRIDYSDGSVWALKQQCLHKLYESMLPDDRRKERKISGALKKEIEKAESNFPNVKIVSQDYRIDQIKIQLVKLIKENKVRHDILLLGESGTGKELFIKAIHEIDGIDRPIQYVDCGAIAPDLFESKFFGHVRGSFTGATDQPGHFAAANRGLLVFDEIGNLSSAHQKKLLRVLEDRKIQPIGSSKDKKVDVRIIFATNESLNTMIEEGEFRSDLYYRIDRHRFEIPSLRERPSDVPLLVDHFVKKHNQQRQNESARPSFSFSEECLKVLMKWRWPGNVRELENLVGEILTKHDENQDEVIITPQDLPKHIRQHSSIPPYKEFSEKTQKDAITDEQILAALTKHDGNRSRAAKELGRSPRTIFRRIKEMERNGIYVPPAK